MLYLHVRCLEKVPKQVSQMVVNDGDEFDRIPIHKKSPSTNRKWCWIFRGWDGKKKSTNPTASNWPAKNPA